MSMRHVLTLLMAASLLAACGSQVVNPVTGRTERTVMDEQSEIAEGQKAHQQVLQEYGAYADPRLQAYGTA
jgi:predicted Zn-dependent protease